GRTRRAAAVWRSAADAVVLYWGSTTGRPVDFTLQVVAIDLAGNESAPQSVSITDDRSHACAVERRPDSRWGLAWIMLVALVASRRQPAAALHDRNAARFGG